MSTVKKILISRTDAIGDVILTLPLCGYLKEKMPDCKIVFLCRTYTLPIVRSCKHVDEIINLDELVQLAPLRQVAYLHGMKIDAAIHVFPNRAVAKLLKEAKIPTRLGTTNRWFHWLYCTKLIPLSRKNSSLHEAQLNIKLAASWLKTEISALEEVKKYYGFQVEGRLPEHLTQLIDPNKKQLIIHPKSAGSGREFPLEKYRYLVAKLLQEGHWQIFVSGTSKEEARMKEFLKSLPAEVVNICGKMTLGEFIDFIDRCDALVASGTGPLHIAAALNKRAIGLFPPIRPINPSRWAPLGDRALAITSAKKCQQNKCKSDTCSCMQNIDANQVIEALNND